MDVQAGIYVRISSDPSGLKAGIQRQEVDCRDYCKRRGWKVTEVYSDNDISAYSGNTRPAYRQMLEDIKANAINAVVVWDLDRLHRHPRELEEFLETCDAAGLSNLGTVSGDVDLATHDGRLMARIMGAVARKESDDKSRRIRRKHLELAEQGRNGGGGDRPFGYEPDRLTVRPEEADLIRQAAQRILAGGSLRGICTDWNARGIKTVRGMAWRQTMLRRMLISGRIAGLRTHHGKVVSTAEWGAIIDRETHEELRSILDANRRPRRQSRKYLLTGGIAQCPLCGHALVARPKQDGRPAYICATGTGFSGCGKIGILGAPLEELVTEAIFEALDSPALMQAWQEVEDDGAGQQLHDALAKYERRLDDLKRDFYVEGLVERADFERLSRDIESRMDAIQRQLATRTGHRVLGEIPSGKEALKLWWESAGFDQRQALVKAVIEKALVHPAVKGRNFFDPNRIEIVWRA